MSSSQSNSHAVQIVAAQASSLANLVSGMSSNTWATWTQGSFPASLSNPLFAQNEDPVTSNSLNCHWDPVNKRIQFYGRGHGNAYQSLMLDFTDASNSWSNTDTPPFAAGISNGQFHQFNGETVDPVTGDLYFWAFGNTVKRRVAGQNSWTTLGNPGQGDHGQDAGAAWNRYSGASGALYVGSFYGIDKWDRATQSWSVLNSGFGAGGLTLGNHCVGFFDEASQAVYFCGGDGTANVKVATNGTCTQKNSIPWQVDNQTSSNNVASIVDSYISARADTNGTVRKPTIIKPGGNMWTYTSATDTWAQIAGVTAPASTATNNALFCGYVSTYDCILMFRQTDSTGGATASVYKP
jgi:hypothetical protein